MGAANSSGCVFLVGTAGQHLTLGGEPVLLLLSGSASSLLVKLIGAQPNLRLEVGPGVAVLCLAIGAIGHLQDFLFCLRFNGARAFCFSQDRKSTRLNSS